MGGNGIGLSPLFINTQMFFQKHRFIGDDMISNAAVGVKNFNRLEQ